MTDTRFVGDPVDTLTGAVFDRKLEFRLTGPLELWWYRHYNSSQNHRCFALGWGHTHDFDRVLRFDGDGISYEAPVGLVFNFPLLGTDGDESARHGFILRRLSLRLYQLFHHGEPAMEFELRDPGRPARLKRLFQGQHQILFRYNAASLLECIVDSAGRIITVVEEANGRLISLSLGGAHGKPSELLMSYQYDQLCNLVRTVNGSGHGHTFAYDTANRLVLVNGRKGFKFHFAYDQQGRCIRAMGDNRLYGVALNYKVPERVTTVTRPDRGVWKYSFDRAGGLAQILDPLGGVQKFIRDETGRVTLEMDHNQNATRIVYDTAGAPIAKITPLGHRIAAPEDPNAPDPLAHRVAANSLEYEYGRLLDTEQITLPDKAQVQELPLSSHAKGLVFVRPDQNGTSPAEKQFEVRPLGVLWWPNPKQGRVFNDLGKLVQQRDEFGRLRHWTYDASGNLAEHADFDGGRWSYDYGSWHFLRELTNPLGADVRFSHTTAGEVASCIDAGGTHSEYSYDLNDHLIEVKRHGVVRETYTRDAVGNLLAKQAGDGRELLRFEIGPGNLPIKRTLASGDEHSFRYDKSGRYLVAATKKDSVEFAYDAWGNRVLEMRNGQGVIHRFQGWRKPAESVFFGRFAVRYEWTKDDTLVITDPGGKSHQIRFHSHGLVERRFSNGSHETAQYDALGRCLFKCVQHGAGPVWSRRYHWSGEGQLRRIEDNTRGGIRHEYDAAHRLRRRIVNGRVENYEMDLADNLVAQPGLSGVTLQDGNRLKTANGSSFAYNDRNHIEFRYSSSSRIRYVYDSRDQLIRVETPEGIWEADYDAQGRRTRKAWAGQNTEYYWNTDQLVAEIAPDGQMRLYVYADPLALVPLGFFDYESVNSPPESGRRYVLFTDQIGAPSRVENDSGVEAWSADIEPFGEAQAATGANTEFNLRLPGHYFDAEIALHYNRFRYYDPALGRYLQSDPWGIMGGINLYAYRPNPLSGVDVRGLGEEDGKCKALKEDEENTGKKSNPKEAKNPLAHMSDEDLQNHCKTRADELSGQMTNPRDQDGVTIAVAVVQKKDDPDSRRVLVTSSQNNGQLPDGVGPLHPNETLVNPGPVLRERNAPPDENGQTPQKIKITEHESGGATAEMVPEKRVYADNPQTGEKGTVPYEKRTPRNPDGATDHHAEQRAQNAVGKDEEIAAMSASKPCCPGCQEALGDNLTKVPPDRRGNQ